MLRFVSFAGLLLTVTPALAQTQPISGQDAQKIAPTAKNGPDRMICETQHEIGSRIASKRVCMTASQWKEHEQNVHSQLDQQHSTIQPTGGPG